MRSASKLGPERPLTAILTLTELESSEKDDLRHKIEPDEGDGGVEHRIEGVEGITTCNVSWRILE